MNNASQCLQIMMLRCLCVGVGVNNLSVLPRVSVVGVNGIRRGGTLIGIGNEYGG